MNKRPSILASSNASTTSLGTEITEYTHKTGGKWASERRPAPETEFKGYHVIADGSSEKRSPRQGSSRVRCTLAGFHYFYGPAEVSQLPAGHRYEGSYLVMEPSEWRPVYVPVYGNANDEDTRDLRRFWEGTLKDAVEQPGWTPYNDTAWNAPAEKTFQLPGPDQVGLKFSDLVNERTEWNFTENDTRLEAWTNALIEREFPNSDNNFDYRQFDTQADFESFIWPARFTYDQGNAPMTLNQINQRHTDVWKGTTVGEPRPHLLHNGLNRTALCVPSIILDPESTIEEVDQTQ